MLDIPQVKVTYKSAPKCEDVADIVRNTTALLFEISYF